MCRCVIFFVFALWACGCFRAESPTYKAIYAHLKDIPTSPKARWENDYFLIIYVNARHLDYSDNYSFLSTLSRQDSDGNRSRNFGHVWIYLQGILNGEGVYVYGGHSGERGLFQAKYFDGIMNYIDFGYANPSQEQLKCLRYEPNPVKYLWDVQRDGFLDWGSGMHKPTYAAKFDLSPLQFEQILDFIKSYDYSNYSLIGNQCSSFAAHMASLAGCDLECEVTMNINSDLYLNGEKVRFWEDSRYAQLTISSPDIVERSLMQAVAEGKAGYVDCPLRDSP